MNTSFLTLLFVGLVLCLARSTSAAAPFLAGVRQDGAPRNLFLSRCVGRGRAVKICRRRRNGFCRPVRCSVGKRRGFRCRCRPAPSPSAINIMPNAACVPGGAMKCSRGHTCSCGGFCRRTVRLTVEAVGDDRLQVFTCGAQIAATPGFNKLARITYEGACDNVIVRAVNLERNGTRRNVVAAAVLVTEGDVVYGTAATVEGVTPIGGVGTFMPAVGFETNAADFDFSAWTPLVPVVQLLTASNFMELGARGARPVCTLAGTAPAGVYGFRLDAPYC